MLAAIRGARKLTLGATDVSRVPESGWSLPPCGWAAACGEEKFDLSEAIARFGDILIRERPLVEIGPRSIFANPAVGGWQ